MSYLTFPHLGLFLCSVKESRSSHLPRAERFIPQLPDGVWASDGSQVISLPSSTRSRRKLPPPAPSLGLPRDPLQGSSLCRAPLRICSAPKSFSLPVRDALRVLSSMNSLQAYLWTTDCFLLILAFIPTNNLQKMFLSPPPLPLFLLPFPYFPSKGRLTEPVLACTISRTILGS